MHRMSLEKKLERGRRVGDLRHQDEFNTRWKRARMNEDGSKRIDRTDILDLFFWSLSPRKDVVGELKRLAKDRFDVGHEGSSTKVCMYDTVLIGTNSRIELDDRIDNNLAR